MSQQPTAAENLGRKLRSLWATLAVICLLGAGAAYGITWYQQDQLERDATRDARKLSVDVIKPLLTPVDAEGPVRGDRYDELLAAMEKNVLAGSVSSVRVWGADGTVLFADDPSLVGDKEPAMRDDVHATIAGTSQSTVDGERYRTLTAIELGQPPIVVAIELGQSHTGIVEQAREQWYPWVRRGITWAIVFAVLYVGTAIFFAVLGSLERRSKRRPDAASANGSSNGRSSGRKAHPASPADPNLPAYMRPGFQEEVEARREVETALEAAHQERAELAERLRRTEAELEQARRRLADLEPTSGALPTR
jgi:hypothetical protein